MFLLAILPTLMFEFEMNIPSKGSELLHPDSPTKPFGMNDF